MSRAAIENESVSTTVRRAVLSSAETRTHRESNTVVTETETHTTGNVERIARSANGTALGPSFATGR